MHLLVDVLMFLDSITQNLFVYFLSLFIHWILDFTILFSFLLLFLFLFSNSSNKSILMF